MSFKNLAERMEVFTHQVDIYPVISSEFCNGRSVLEVIDKVGQGGAKIFQLREKHCSDKALYLLGLEARKIADKYGMIFLVDDRLDIAMACGADGVHLGQDDLAIAAAKAIAPTTAITVVITVCLSCEKTG